MKSKRLIGIIIASTLIFSTSFIGCANAQEHEEEGEESGTMYTKEQTYKQVRSGVQLTLKYDKATQAFLGTMENVSKKVAKKARVEVHLSNGVELGPTKPGNLKAGEKTKVKLDAKGQKFEKWNCHAEVGSNEHGHGEGGEHGEKGHDEEGGEHSKKLKKVKKEHSERETGEHGK
jgi:hypothetical protein